MRRAVIASAASVVVACSIFTSFDGIEPREASLADADAAIDVGAPDSAEAGCVLERWPDPPPGTDTGRDVGDLVSAVTVLHFLDPFIGGKPQGFDLDGLCTCPGRAACVGTKPNCDLFEAGVDNAGDELLRTFNQQAGGSALDREGLQMGIKAGRYGLIVRIREYDGERNDPKVLVSLLNAVAVNGDGGVPRNDGTDEWTIDKESQLDPRFPTYFSTTAYVTNGLLVAELPRAVLRARVPLGGGKWSLIELDMRAVHLVARLGARSGKGIALEGGRIAGRMPESAWFTQGMRSGVCAGSPPYEALKALVCQIRDLPTDPAKDGRDVPCEALSAGFGFTSGPALIAPGSGSRVDVIPCPIVADRCP